MATVPNCAATLMTLDITCEKLKTPGGVDGKVYLGFRSEIDTVTFGTNGEITALTLTATKKLVRFKSKKEAHEIKATIKTGLVRNMFDHQADLELYPDGQTDYKAIESLVNAYRMFAIVETLNGKIIVYGIDQNPNKTGEIDDERGLEVTAGEFPLGKEYQTGRASKVTLMGTMFQMPKYYKPSQDLTTNLAELEALC